MDGEAYFALAMEWLLWRALRSFPRRRLYSRSPPNCDVQGRGLLCPLNIDSGRSASKIFYPKTFATTIRAISGLSRQTHVRFS
jgi:hypothetical protein